MWPWLTTTLSWLTTLNLDWGNDLSFHICYHNFPMDTYLKHYINAYQCVCWMQKYVSWWTWWTLYPLWIRKLMFRIMLNCYCNMYFFLSFDIKINMYTWWFWQAWNFKLQNVVPMEYSVKNTVYMVYIYIYILKLKLVKKNLCVISSWPKYGFSIN